MTAIIPGRSTVQRFNIQPSLRLSKTWRQTGGRRYLILEGCEIMGYCRDGSQNEEKRTAGDMIG